MTKVEDCDKDPPCLCRRCLLVLDPLVKRLQDQRQSIFQHSREGDKIPSLGNVRASFGTAWHTTRQAYPRRVELSFDHSEEAALIAVYDQRDGNAHGRSQVGPPSRFRIMCCRLSRIQARSLLQVFEFLYPTRGEAMRFCERSRHAPADGDMDGIRWRACPTPAVL